MISVVAPEGVFAEADESLVLKRVHAALAAAIDATDDPAVSGIIGATLDVVPRHRYTMGGIAVNGVRIDVALPSVALSSFRRRKHFIRDATAAVVALSSDPSISERVIIRVLHLVDGGWGMGGHQVTNEDIDEGPEETI